MTTSLARRPLRSRLAAGAGSLALAAGALAMSTGPAGADHGPSPSDSSEACTAAGGTFDDLGDGVSTCTVVEVDLETRPSHNTASGFTVEFEVTTTTVYTTTVTQEWVEGPSHCLNPAGQPIPYAAWNPANPHVGNRNCIAAHKAGGAQTTQPFFTIAPGGYWETVVKHSEDTDVDEERVGCRNSTGNPVEGWPSNPNCFTTDPTP